MRWTEDEENLLIKRMQELIPYSKLTKELNRTATAISAKAKLLGLNSKTYEEEYAQYELPLTDKAYVYLAYIPSLEIYKIGHTVNLKRRLNSFNYKLDLIFYRGFSTVTTARKHEKLWLSNVSIYKVNTGLLWSGNTETFKF